MAVTPDACCAFADNCHLGQSVVSALRFIRQLETGTLGLGRRFGGVVPDPASPPGGGDEGNGSPKASRASTDGTRAMG